MDATPTEIVAHILSFLDGDDIAQFNSLNTRFRDIIKRNRANLSCPMFSVSLDNINMSNAKKINIHIKKKWCCLIDYTNPDSVLICPTEEGTSFCWFKNGGNETCRCCYSTENQERIKRFFSFFYTGSNQSLQAVFEYILGKMHINELYVCHAQDKESISALTSAIQKISPLIEEISFYPTSIETNVPGNLPLEIRVLLTTVVNNKRKGTNYPRMQFCSLLSGDEWPVFLEINEIAKDYKSSLLCLNETLISWTFNRILKEWVRGTFSKLNIGLSIPSTDEPVPFAIAEMDDRFEIKEKEGDHLLFHSVEKEISSAVLSDRNTGRSLLFTKKNGSRIDIDEKQDPHKTVNIFIDIL